MGWLRRFGERGWRTNPQGGNSATSLCAAILTVCGFYVEAIRVVFPVDGFGLDLPGRGDTPVDPFAKPAGDPVKSFPDEQI
jgi:hypothetical protein